MRSKTAIVAVAAVLSLMATAIYAADADLIKARQKFFGRENVDVATGELSKEKVVLSWLSNSSFAISIAGHVLYFDTFATRLEVMPGRTPFAIKDMVALKPEAVGTRSLGSCRQCRLHRG